jgi:hypothetical protein
VPSQYCTEYGQIAVLRTVEDNINSHSSDLVRRIENKMTEMMNKIKELNQKVTRLENENDELKGKVDDQSNKIETLEGRLNDIEQGNLSLNLEIHGYPQNAGEDVKDIVQEVADVIGAPETAAHIRYMYRGRRMRNNKPPPLVVIFDNESARNLWLEGRKCPAFKQFRKPVLFSESAAATGNASGGGGPAKEKHHQVRIFEQLTFANRQLLFETKKAAHECGYAFAWSKGGKIFARREHQGPITRITSMNDILTKMRLQKKQNPIQDDGSHGPDKR